MWRLTTNNPAAYAHWMQIDLGSPTLITGVATSPGAMWSGTMYVTHFHVRYCAEPAGTASSCSVWRDARNWDGGLIFDGPQPSGSTMSHTHCSNCALPSTGTNGKARAFLQAPGLVAQIVRIYPIGPCPWVCGIRAGVLAAYSPPSPPPPA